MSHLLAKSDARRIPLPDGCVQCCVTSPPYFGLRSYLPDGHPLKEKEIGLEPTPDEFVAAMVAVYREVRRVLRADGVAFLNLGDSYNAYNTNRGPSHSLSARVDSQIPRVVGGVSRRSNNGERQNAVGRDLGDVREDSWGCHPERANRGSQVLESRLTDGSLKPKDLIGIPWRVALALRKDGWYLRDAIVWSKAEVDEDDNLEGSAMPGSQRDRCTSAHEMLFQLTKSARYFFDDEAIKTASGAMLRNVWRINTEAFPGSHFAVMPRKLVEPCVKAGTSQAGCCPSCGTPWARVVERERLLDGHRAVGGGWKQDDAGRIGANGVGHWRITTKSTTLGFHQSCQCPPQPPVPCLVLDPFSGASTTGVVALALGRRYVGFDLNPEYLDMAARRISRPHAPARKVEKPMPLFGDAS